MYYVGGKLLSGIKSMHVDGLALVRVKDDDSGDKGMYHVPLAFK